MLVSDPFPSFECLTLTQLGKLYGQTSHTVGRWLKEMGLRLSDGEPSQNVIDSGLAEKVIPESGHSFWAWQKDRTVALLERAGHRRAGIAHAPDPPPSILTGPFTARPSGGDDHEITNASGTAVVWTKGETSARKIEWLLNLAHQHQKL